MEIINNTDVIIQPEDGTVNWTLVSDGNMTTQNLSHPPTPETMVLHAGLSYSVVTLACLFLLLGVFGNGMTLAVTLKSETRFKPHNMLIMSLAVADTLSLLTNSFNIEAFGEISLIDMRALKATSNFTCKLFNAFYRTSIFSSTLMIMLICIERFIAVCFPLKARIFITKRLTILSVTACIVVTIVTTALPSAVHSGIRNGVCYLDFDIHTDGENDTVMNISNPLLLVIPILFVVTPLVIILTLTPLTICKLYQQRVTQRGLTSQQASTGPDRATVLLTTVVVVYLTLTGIPQVVFAAISASGTNIATSTESSGVIAKMCFAIIAQANYSTNFILYTWLSTEFRENLFSMLGCSCC